MKKPFKEVSLTKRVFRVEDLPVGTLPEIAFLGRSNVGKSSLINAFVGQKRLARVSSRPGFTQALHFFRVDHRFWVVDLPGYGFAKAPADVQKNWSLLIEKYLTSPRPIKLLIVIFDLRRKPDDLDNLLINYITQQRRPFVMVLNKVDRVKKTSRPHYAKAWVQAFGPRARHTFLISCRTSEGIKEFRHFVLQEIFPQKG